MTIHKSGKYWSTSVRKAAEEIDAKFPRKDWTSTYAQHGEGSPVGAFAVDYMCNKADGDKIAEYAWRNRKRLGIRYVIWWGKIISETSATPNRLVRYFNADNPNPSKSHKNHVHVSHYPNAKFIPIEGVTVLPVYLVDPDKVTTTLIGNPPTGKESVSRPPLFEISNGVQIDGHWLVTEDGYRYHTDYLVLETEYDKRPKSEVNLPTISLSAIGPLITGSVDLNKLKLALSEAGLVVVE